METLELLVCVNSGVLLSCGWCVNRLFRTALNTTYFYDPFKCWIINSVQILQGVYKPRICISNGVCVCSVLNWGGCVNRQVFTVHPLQFSRSLYTVAMALNCRWTSSYSISSRAVGWSCTGSSTFRYRKRCVSRYFSGRDGRCTRLSFHPAANVFCLLLSQQTHPFVLSHMHSVSVCYCLCVHRV